MNQKNGRSTTTQILDPFSRKYDYRLLWGSAVVGMMYGVIVVPVLAASPVAISAVKCMAPACAVLGAAAGAGYGFFFNIANRCRRGSIVWGMIGGTLAAAVGTLGVALMAVIVGAVIVGALVGFGGGWVVGSLLTTKRRAVLPLLGAAIGAVIQAGWTDPLGAMKTAVWGGAVGAVSGPLFLATCAALGYFVLRRTKPRALDAM